MTLKSSAFVFACFALIAWIAYPLPQEQYINSVQQIMKECTFKIQKAIADNYSDQFDNLENDLPKFLGVPTLQSPNDLFTMQEIISEIQPDVIIETGTYRGGSALFYASVLKHANPSGLVITIDISDESVSEQLRSTENIKFIHGNSVAENTLTKVTQYTTDKKVMVTLDSNHEADHVYNELEAYSKLVSVGSYIVVQDTYLDSRWGTKKPPIAAVLKFISLHPEFVIDKSRQRFYMTNYFDGFLKRIK